MIKELVISIGLSNINYRHYIALGYRIPKRINKYGKLTCPMGTKIEVKVEHLPDGSNALVTKVCDICESINIMQYNQTLRSKGCRKCSSFINLKKGRVKHG